MADWQGTAYDSIPLSLIFSYEYRMTSFPLDPIMAASAYMKLKQLVWLIRLQTRVACTTIPAVLPCQSLCENLGYDFVNEIGSFNAL